MLLEKTDAFFEEQTCSGPGQGRFLLAAARNEERGSTRHAHGVLYFANPQLWKSILEWLRVHICEHIHLDTRPELADRDPDRALSYLNKPDSKYVDQWLKKDTHVAGPYVWGKFPPASARGARQELPIVKAAALLRNPETQLTYDQAHEQFANVHMRYRSYFYDYCPAYKRLNGKPEVWLYIAASRAGKTFSAEKFCDDHKLTYFTMTDVDWFNQVPRFHDAAIWNNFRSTDYDLKTINARILPFLDNSSLLLPTKGSFVPWRGKCVIITTVQPLDAIFAGHPSRAEFFGRVDFILCGCNDGRVIRLENPCPARRDNFCDFASVANQMTRL